MTTYIILSSLTIFQSILKCIKDKSRIQGYDTISDVLGGILAFISIIIPLIAVQGSLSTKQLIIKAFVVGISAYIGNIIASKMFDKIKKDDVWTLFIIPKTRKHGKQIADTLREHNIKTYTLEGYYNKESVLSSIVYTKTKAESNFVKQICKGKANCKRIY